MLFLLFIAIIKGQIYTHTFLVLDQSNSIGLPNHLNRQIFNTNQTFIPKMENTTIKKNILYNNFSNYLNDTKFSYGKSKLQAEVFYFKNQAIIAYYQYQNLLSIQEIKEQYEELKKLYLTDEFIILIHNKVDKQITQNIAYTTNPQKYIKDYQLQLQYIDRDMQYNFTQEIVNLLLKKSYCESIEQYMSQIRNYNQYKEIWDQFKQIDKIQYWINGWLINNNTEFAQLLFDQHITQIEEILNKFDTQCTSDIYMLNINFENYQYTMLSVCLIGFYILKHFIENSPIQEDEKNKFV